MCVDMIQQVSKISLFIIMDFLLQLTQPSGVLQSPPASSSPTRPSPTPSPSPSTSRRSSGCFQAAA
jgi:hypothetical protein